MTIKPPFAQIRLQAMRSLATLLVAGTMSHGVAATSFEFDHSLLAGTWADSDSTAPVCAKNNLHYKLELSADGKTLVFKLDRKWKIATGAHVEQYSATVIDVEPQMLTIRYNADIGPLPPDYPAKWEMAFVAPGIYRWRATEWRGGQVSTIVGVRCEP